MSNTAPSRTPTLQSYLLFYVSYSSNKWGFIGYDTRNAIRGIPSPTKLHCSDAASNNYLANNIKNASMMKIFSQILVYLLLFIKIFL